MNADTVAQILFWLAVAGFISGFVYLLHRLTAPAARRMNDAVAQRHYAALAARGQNVVLPRTWLSGGLAGHDWNTDPGFRQMVRSAGLAILAAFALGVWLRSDVISLGQALGELATSLVIVGAVFLGIRVYDRHRVKRALASAGDLAPRGSFKVVANAHGLFVPVAWSKARGAIGRWRTRRSTSTSTAGPRVTRSRSLIARTRARKSR